VRPPATPSGREERARMAAYKGQTDGTDLKVGTTETKRAGRVKPHLQGENRKWAEAGAAENQEHRPFGLKVNRSVCAQAQPFGLR